MAHAPAGPFARLPAPPWPEDTVLAEARRLFDKQRAEEDHCGMMPAFEALQPPVLNAWKEMARRRLEWRAKK